MKPCIWFTSDTHFNHAKIIKYSSRPFVDLAEMTETLIDRWNDVVRPCDTVYHLGDFALSWGKKHTELIDGILSRLNGQKILVSGNHDREEVKKNPRWSSVKDYHEISVAIGTYHKQKIVMFHYPLRSWSGMHRGSWMLHGHCHGTLPLTGRILDVGVDVHNYKPISLERVRMIMDRAITPCRGPGCATNCRCET